MKSGLQPLEKAQLCAFLVEQFTQSELELLAFDLGADYKIVTCPGKETAALEMVAYFEHRRQLGCLLAETIRRRPHHNLAHLLPKAPACTPVTKIQFVVHHSPETSVEIAPIVESLIQTHALNREEVSLIAAAQGSLRLLLGVPAYAADRFQRGTTPQQVGVTSNRLLTAVPFSDLPERSQKIWRMVACEWPPLALENALVPRISWQKAAEIFRLKEKDAILRLLAAGDAFGSHRTRISLTALTGYAQLLALTGSLNEKQASYVEKLEQASEEFVESLTVLYNLISSREEAVTVRFLLQRILIALSPIAEQTGIVLETDVGHSLAESEQGVRGNVVLLAKAVTALCLNGIQYSPPNGRIRLTARLATDHLHIQVQDDGDPVPVAAAAEIFNLDGQRPFAQPTRKSPVGSGLGLHLTKLVIEQIEGKVWLEPQPKLGNIFHLAIPFGGV